MSRRFRRRRGPVAALGDGRFEVQFDTHELELVKRLLDQLRGLITHAPADDPRLRRLFPAAYHDDPELDVEYQRLMRDELVASRLAALDAVDDTLGQSTMTTDQLGALMRSTNAVRLVLGTLLDLDDDTEPGRREPSDPLYAEEQLYLWLSWVLEHVVEALHSGLAQS